jgi:hypothetical protein
MEIIKNLHKPLDIDRDHHYIARTIYICDTNYTDNLDKSIS